MNEFEMMKKILKREEEIFKITEIEGEGPEIIIFNPQSFDPSYSVVLVEEEFEELAQQYRECDWYDEEVKNRWDETE